jgi:uncharacterized membrane protein YkoI
MGGTAEAQSMRPDWAAPRGQNDAEADNILSIRDIIGRVRGQVGGEFVSMRRLERNANPPFYELRWRFSNEVVEDIRVNATNGRVMSR